MFRHNNDKIITVLYLITNKSKKTIKYLHDRSLYIN